MGTGVLGRDKEREREYLGRKSRIMRDGKQEWGGNHTRVKEGRKERSYGF